MRERVAKAMSSVPVCVMCSNSERESAECSATRGERDGEEVVQSFAKRKSVCQGLERRECRRYVNSKERE